MSAAELSRRRRTRWPWVLGIVLVVLAALVVAGELVARAVVAQQVRAQVISALKLPSDQQLDVAVDGIVLPQLVAGRLDALHLSSRKVEIGPVVGAVSVDATGVPIRGGRLGEASGTVRIDAAQLQGLLKITSLPVEKVSLGEGTVKAEGSATVLGNAVPLAVTLAPGAEDGRLVLTPRSVSIGTVTLEPSDDSSPFAAALRPLFSPQRVCIADRLPAGVHLQRLTVEGEVLAADFSADSAITEDARLREPGSCS